ncbi:hypothetical protein [Flavobacterium gelidilacus]|uniref:hypothetical protein n=1 Tax=Flavobacterium gelidilacus TaxID=206041 RepID=UPI0012FA8C65|nr:hypothetical protein [Flavobacterium gelidilacus]
MKKTFSIIVFCLSLFSCTDEPNSKEYKVTVFNNSSETLIIETYKNNVLLSNSILNTGEKGVNCTYNFESFIGYQLNTCQIDSIVFKFAGNKGYLSSINNPTIYDFPDDNNPFGKSSKFIINNNVYEFTINQEDFINAFDLP